MRVSVRAAARSTGAPLLRVKREHVVEQVHGVGLGAGEPLHQVLWRVPLHAAKHAAKLAVLHRLNLGLGGGPDHLQDAGQLVRVLLDLGQHVVVVLVVVVAPVRQRVAAVAGKQGPGPAHVLLHGLQQLAKDAAHAPHLRTVR